MEYPDPVPSMDYLSKPERNSADQKSLGRSENNMPWACQNTKLQEKIKSEKPSLSYADFHHEITKNSKLAPLKFAGNPRKQRLGGKEVDEDELVKYMSNLPSYLQRGETLKEKALNFGVLDWRLLEKWQYGQKQMIYRSNRYSPSSSNTSSSFSTDEASTHSSRGHSCSPTRQRTCRPSLQSHLTSSMMEGPSQVFESSRESLRKFQQIESTESGGLNRSENFINTASALSQKHLDVETEECKNSASELIKERNPVNEALRDELITGMATCTMKKTETQAVEGKRRDEKIQKSNLEHHSSNGNKKIVLLLPKGVSESSNSGELQNSNLAALADRKSKTCQRSFSEGCNKASRAEISSDVPHSSPLFSRVDDSKGPPAEQLSSRDSAAVSIHCPSGLSKPVSQPFNMGSNPARGKNLEAKKATTIEHSRALEQKLNIRSTERVRSVSPFYRFTSGLSKMGKSLSSNDSSDIRNQRSIDVPAKSGPGNSHHSSGDASRGGRLNATGRERSSPLRRLLDPLLKPKAENFNSSMEPSERVSVSTDKACKFSGVQHVSLAPPAKVKLGMIGCKKISVNELAIGKKHGSSTVQALLGVAVKNGLPLYSFAVNNDNNIVAATVKMLDPEKHDGCSCVYTFFTIHDMKKKNGSWINQGGRGKGQDYVSNVVSQMKVLDSGSSNLSAQNIGVRNFVLFSVGLRQAEDQTPEFQPNDELAAIVIKFPKRTSPSSTKDEHAENTSRLNSRNSLAGDAQCQPFFSTTVILPSATHSLPSKGGPSSLIERWISGGSCDCGGWDMGCKLRILTNLKKSGPSQGGYPTPDRLELFPQGGLQENQQVLSLAQFKEGSYSVEYHSSLSALQAFSICTALLDTRKQCELLESSHSVEGKAFGEPVSVQNAGTSGPSRTEADGPRYVSYPPHSPVGRV